MRWIRALPLPVPKWIGPGTGVPQGMGLAAFAAAFVAAAWAIGMGSAVMGRYTSVQVAILAGILLPALWLAMTESRKLVPYIVLIWAVCPEIRRVSDWLEGTFHSVSLLGAAPLLTSAVLIIPVLANLHRIDGSVRKLFLIPSLILAYGAVIGLAGNGASALYDLANYAVPMLLIPYFAVIRIDERDQDRLIVAFASTAMLVAAYGIVQYLTVPPWDAFWMNHVEMSSIGTPYPLEIRVFSTLNSPGPAAMFMAIALAPMIVEKRWRGPLGWFGVLLVAVGILITLVRSSWVMLIVIAAFYTAVSAGRMKWKLLGQMGAVSVALWWLIPKLPGAQGLIARLDTVTDIQQDHSYNERLDFFHTVVPILLGKPQGLGLGSIGVGTKLSNDGALGEFGIFDNGFVAIFLTFGVVGGVLFFWTLWLLAKLLLSRKLLSGQSPAFARLAAASLVGSVVCLLFENGYTGLRGFLQWMIVGIGVAAHGAIARRRRREALDAATDEPQGASPPSSARVS